MSINCYDRTKLLFNKIIKKILIFGKSLLFSQEVLLDRCFENRRRSKRLREDQDLFHCRCKRDLRDSLESDKKEISSFKNAHNTLVLRHFIFIICRDI